MNRCDACKHWRPFDEAGDGQYEHGYGPIRKNRLGLCGGIGQEGEHTGGRQVDGTMKEPDDIMACTTDLSDMSDLRTRADFGCALWEAKR